MIINGRNIALPVNPCLLTYEEIVFTEYGRQDLHPTVTYQHAAQEKDEGILIKGQRVYVDDKTIINTAFTNYA